MKIIALILFLLLSASSLHAADKPVKVYSAHELQKIADGIYREMNNQGQEEQVEVNLLKNPSAAVTLKANPLKQIEKALEADNQDALRQIYHSAVSASSGQTENKVSQPVAITAPVRPAAPEVPAVVSRPAVRRADSRLDAWIRRQSGEETLSETERPSAVPNSRPQPVPQTWPVQPVGDVRPQAPASAQPQNAAAAQDILDRIGQAAAQEVELPAVPTPSFSN